MCNYSNTNAYGLVGNDAIGGDRFVYLEDIELTNGSGYTTRTRAKLL